VHKEYSKKEKVAPHIQEFIDLFIRPIYDSSIIVSQRKILRESPELNQYLFDNQHSLLEIFDVARSQPLGEKNPGLKDKFTVNAAYKFYGLIKHPMCLFTQSVIDQCFQFSQMTVLDEAKKGLKYYYLNFIEFVDMICRMVITAVKRVDTIENVM